MKILMFMSSGNVGGSERMSFTLLRHWKKQAQVRCVVGRSGPLIDDELVDDLDLLETRRMRHAIGPLAKIIEEWKPDILFAAKPDASLALTLAWCLSGRQGQLVLRESNHRTAQGLSSWSPFMLALGWAYRRADLMIAPSVGIREDLVLRYRITRKHLAVIHNPVDAERIHSLAEQESPVLEGASRNAFEIMALGRLVYQKGFDLLLEAIHQVLSQSPQSLFHVTIIGEGPERIGLQRQITQLGLKDVVRLVGVKENPYPYLKQADLFVLSSRWEGFPNALAEAMILGVPCVSTQCPSGPDEMIVSGINGYLVQPNQSEALAEGIRYALAHKDQCQSWGQMAAEAARSYYAQAIAQNYLNLFAQQLGEVPLERQYAI